VWFYLFSKTNINHEKTKLESFITFFVMPIFATMKSIIGVIWSCAVLFSCSTNTPSELKSGIWRGVIEQQGQQIPFTFKVVEDSAGGKDVYLQNAEEELLLDEVHLKNNQVDVTLHVFDACLQATIKGDCLNGSFILNYRNNFQEPFKAKYGQQFRFNPTNSAVSTTEFSGKYQVVFSNEIETYPAVGIFTQKGNYVTGTFLAPTGDYRYLEGGVFNDSLYLSTFDGNHTYLFKATKQNDSTLLGKFWSGDAEYDWKGLKNEHAALPDPEAITFLKNGYDYLTFTFPDLNGKMVSLQGTKFKGKVVIVQIFGSWCSNGMDVTKFLSTYYQTKNAQVEILGLAFERRDNFRYASARVAKMKEKLNVPYDILIAGINDKEKASQTLPELNSIKSFPTTIFVGKDGKVKHIYSGFNGPGTGTYHQQLAERFHQIISECLAQEIE
jgi:thiol-disulfide isomerase/thioredoxin